MTAQMILMVVTAVFNALLIPFVVWLVKENTAHKVELARMRTEFVTWKQLETWRTDTAAEFSRVRELIQTVAIAVARLEGHKE